MNIHFDHCGQDFQAEISYNFKEIRDCFILKFLNGFGRDITFYKEGEVWNAASELQMRFPNTYLIIQKAITEAFRVKEILADFRFQNICPDKSPICF